jgi:hypothetical protein
MAMVLAIIGIVGFVFVMAALVVVGNRGIKRSRGSMLKRTPSEDRSAGQMGVTGSRGSGPQGL